MKVIIENDPFVPKIGYWGFSMKIVDFTEDEINSLRNFLNSFLIDADGDWSIENSHKRYFINNAFSAHMKHAGVAYGHAEALFNFLEVMGHTYVNRD